MGFIVFSNSIATFTWMKPGQRIQVHPRAVVHFHLASILSG